MQKDRLEKQKDGLWEAPPPDFTSFLKPSLLCSSICWPRAFSFYMVLFILTLFWNPISTPREEQLPDSVCEELKARIGFNSTYAPRALFLFALSNPRIAPMALARQASES